MTKVLVLGASGQIARWAVEMLADIPEVELTLFLRDVSKLPARRLGQYRVIEGDVLNREELDRAMANQDVVYANLAGEVDRQAERIVASMQAADVIEASGLDYTILRAAWLTDDDEVAYETTQRDEPFKGTEVSRKSVAALITEIIQRPELYAKRNLGVNKPNTDGDKPAFM